MIVNFHLALGITKVWYTSAIYVIALVGFAILSGGRVQVGGISKVMVQVCQDKFYRNLKLRRDATHNNTQIPVRYSCTNWLKIEILIALNPWDSFEWGQLYYRICQYKIYRLYSRLIHADYVYDPIVVTQDR